MTNHPATEHHRAEALVSEFTQDAPSQPPLTANDDEPQTTSRPQAEDPHRVDDATRPTDNVVPLPGTQATPEVDKDPDEDDEDGDSETSELDLVISVAQAMLAMPVPSPDTIKAPEIPPSNTHAVPDAGDAFQAKYSNADAAVSATSEIELLIKETIPKLSRKIRRRLARMAETVVIPEDAGKQSWTFLKALYGAGAWVTWIGLSGVSVYFIEDYILAGHPTLQLDDAGLLKAFIPALCVPLLSTAATMALKNKEEPVQKTWMNRLLWVGAPLLMAGLIPLLGTTVPGGAPSYEGRFADGAQPLITEETWRQIWLAARLFGELFVATACRIGIDLFFNRHKPRRPNKKYLTLKRRLDKMTGLVKPLKSMLVKIEPVKVRSYAWQREYWAGVSNSRVPVTGVKVTRNGDR
jgi:hypothetical protein